MEGLRCRVVVRVLVLGGLDGQAAGGERGVGAKVAGRGQLVVTGSIVVPDPATEASLDHTHRAPMLAEMPEPTASASGVSAAVMAAVPVTSIAVGNVF